jgi:hypothetical protein
MAMARIKLITTGMGKLSDTNLYKRLLMLGWTQGMNETEVFLQEVLCIYSSKSDQAGQFTVVGVAISWCPLKERNSLCFCVFLVFFFG